MPELWGAAPPAEEFCSVGTDGPVVGGEHVVLQLDDAYPHMLDEVRVDLHQVFCQRNMASQSCALRTCL